MSDLWGPPHDAWMENLKQHLEANPFRPPTAWEQFWADNGRQLAVIWAVCLAAWGVIWIWYWVATH